MKRVVIGSASVLIAVISIGDCAIAQVVPDNTVGTTVNLNGTAFEINNGTRSGNNLFHSFSQFSVPTGGSALFNNPTDVQTIFGRVTGSHVSNIDGLIKTQGGANLFLMNPNGIVFGPNAQLQLGGSFLGTTATGIQFADGIEFNTVNATPALLSVNVPIGLQMGTNPGSITVQGNGHTLITLLPRSIPVPTQRDPSNTGLTLMSGKTIALVGGDIQLTGGILTNEQGRIELGAVRSGTVELGIEADQKIALSYANAFTYGNLRLDQRSLIDVSGNIGGMIALQGQNLSLTGGSTVFNQNLGNQSAGKILINAIESVHLQGATPATQTTMRSESLGSGQGAQIEVNTRQLIIESSAAIDVAGYGDGRPGVIQIDAADRIKVSGFSLEAPFVPSAIGNTTFGNAQASETKVKTQTLEVLAGGVLGSSALGLNRGSDLMIQTSDILVSGWNPVIQLPSTIATTTFNRGNGGNLTIDADRILVRDIGFIASSTLAQGSAGQITLRASQWIESNGPGASINSSADRLSPIFQAAFGLPAIPSGSSNSLNLNTPQLRILNGGEVSVRSNGPGRAGSLMINANSIQLNDGGRITASTVSGNGGNIQLNVTDRVIMRNKSMIANNSFGFGDGGYTSINTPVLVGLGNSDIEANAIQGTGGTIQIRTQSIFGLQYRDRLTSQNDITASSEFGINGNVQVNTIGINPTNALNTLPVDITDSSRQIADRCGNAKGGSLVATGRGGIPQSPMQKHGADRTWHDLREIGRDRSVSNAVIIPIAQAPGSIVEASAIEVDETGAIDLVAHHAALNPTPVTCGLSSVPPSKSTQIR